MAFLRLCWKTVKCKSEGTEQRSEEARRAAENAGNAVVGAAGKAGGTMRDVAEGVHNNVERQQAEATVREDAAHAARQARRDEKRLESEAIESKHHEEEDKERVEGGEREMTQAQHPLNIDDEFDGDGEHNDYGLVGGSLHRGSGDAWSNAVPTVTDMTLQPHERSQQMEGYPFTDQTSSPMANLEGSTAHGIQRLKSHLAALQRGLEATGGHRPGDRAGLRYHAPVKQRHDRDSVVCAVPGLADVVTGLGVDWCAHGTGKESGVGARPLMRMGPQSHAERVLKAEEEEENRLKRGAEAVDAAEV